MRCNGEREGTEGLNDRKIRLRTTMRRTYVKIRLLWYAQNVNVYAAICKLCARLECLQLEGILQFVLSIVILRCQFTFFDFLVVRRMTSAR